MAEKKAAQEQDHPLITPEEARRYLAEEQAKRLELCKQELGILLAERGCRLTAAARITEDGRIVAEPMLEIADNG